MAKTKKITETGPIGLRGIRNSDVYSRLSNLAASGDADAANIIKGLSMSPATPGSYGNVEQYYRPTADPHNSPWNELGKSMFDDPYIISNDASDINENRAYNEPLIAKWGSALGNGLTLAATTFIDGTVGLMYGASRAIGNIFDLSSNARSGFIGGLSYIWDNEISNGLLGINKVAEEAMPFYQSLEYLELPWYAKGATADFWADGVLKNLGFMVGAYYSGGAWNKILNGTIKGVEALATATKATLKLTTAYKEAEGLGTMGSRITGSLLSATNEARIEANQNSSDWYQQESLKLYDGFKKYYQEKGLDPGQIKNDPNYQARLLQLEENKAKVGAWDFFSNLPILAVDDFYTYGKLYSRGFSNALDVAKNVAKEGAESSGWLSTWRRLKNAGNEGLKAEAREAANIILEDGRYVAKEITTKETLGKVLKTAVREGNEEMAQQMAANFAGNLYSADNPDAYYYAAKDPNSIVKANDMMTSLTKAFADSYGDGNQWEQFAVGAVSSLLGMPTFGKVNNSDANTVFGKGKTIGWSGGILGEFASDRAANEEARRNVDVMNKVAERIKNQRGHYAKANSFTNAMDGFSEEGDKFEYKNAEDNLDFASIQAFSNAGRLEDLKKLVGQDFENMSDEELGKIALFNSNKDKDGNIIGGWMTDDGHPMASVDEDGKINISQENALAMREKLKQKRDKTLKQIDDYAKSLLIVRSIGNNSLSDEQTLELAWLRWKQNQFADRFNSIKEENADGLNGLIEGLQNWEDALIEARKDMTEETTTDEEGNIVVDENSKETKKLRENKNVLLNVRNAKALLKGMMESKNPLGAALFLKQNPKFAELMKSGEFLEFAKAFTEKCAMTHDEYVDAMLNFIDTTRLAEAASTFNDRYLEFITDPYSVISGRQKDEKKREAQIRANDNVTNRDNVNNATVSDLVQRAEEGESLDDLAAIFEEGGAPQNAEEAEQWQQEGKKKVQEAKHIVDTKNKTKLELLVMLSDGVITLQQYDDALALLDNSSHLSQSNDDLTDLSSFAYNDPTVLEVGNVNPEITELELNEYMATRMDGAQTALSEAMATINQREDETSNLPDAAEIDESQAIAESIKEDLDGSLLAGAKLTRTQNNTPTILDADNNTLLKMAEGKLDEQELSNYVEVPTMDEFKLGDSVETMSGEKATIEDYDDESVLLSNGDLLSTGNFLSQQLQVRAKNAAKKILSDRKGETNEPKTAGRDGAPKNQSENERKKQEEKKKAEKKEVKTNTVQGLATAIADAITIGLPAELSTGIRNMYNSDIANIAQELFTLKQKGVDAITAIHSIKDTAPMQRISELLHNSTGYVEKAIVEWWAANLVEAPVEENLDLDVISEEPTIVSEDKNPNNEEMARQVANATDKANKASLGTPYQFWTPATSEVTSGFLRGEQIPFWKVAEKMKDNAGNPKYTKEYIDRLKAVYNYLKENNAWNNAFAIKKGDKIEFVIDPSLKTAVDKEGNPTEGEPVILMRVNGKIVGDVMSPTDSSFNRWTGMSDFVSRVLGEYNQWKKSNSGIFVSKETSTVSKKMVGKVPFTDQSDRRSLNQIHQTTTSTGETVNIPFKIGIQVSEGGSRVLMTPGRTKESGASKEESTIIRLLNAKAGLTFLLMPTGNESRAYMPIPIMMPRYSSETENSKLGKEIDKTLNKLSTLKKGEEVSFIRELQELLSIPAMHLNILDDGSIKLTIRTSGDKQLTTVYQGKIDDAAIQKIKLKLHNTPFLISRKYINTTFKDGTDYNSMIGELATCNLAEGSTHTINSWFTANPVMPTGEVKAKNPTSTKINPHQVDHLFSQYTHSDSKGVHIISINNTDYSAWGWDSLKQQWVPISEKNIVAATYKAYTYIKNNNLVADKSGLIATPWGTYNTKIGQFENKQVSNTSTIQGVSTEDKQNGVVKFKFGENGLVRKAQDTPIVERTEPSKTELEKVNVTETSRSGKTYEGTYTITKEEDNFIRVTHNGPAYYRVTKDDLNDLGISKEDLLGDWENNKERDKEWEELEKLTIDSVSLNKDGKVIVLARGIEGFTQFEGEAAEKIARKLFPSLFELNQNEMYKQTGPAVKFTDEQTKEFELFFGPYEEGGGADIGADINLLFTEPLPANVSYQLSDFSWNHNPLHEGELNWIKEHLKEDNKKYLKSFFEEKPSMQDLVNDSIQKIQAFWDKAKTNSKDNITRDNFEEFSSELTDALEDLIGTEAMMKIENLQMMYEEKDLEKQMLEDPTLAPFVPLMDKMRQIIKEYKLIVTNEETRKVTPSEMSEEECTKKAISSGLLTTNTTQQLWKVLNKEQMATILNLPKLKAKKIISALSRDFDVKNNTFKSDVNLIISDTRNREESSKPIQRINIEQETKWLESVLPNLATEDRLRVVNGLISIANSHNSQKAWGQFKDGIITISNQAARGTVYHEAFHSVTHTLLSTKEIETLFDAAKEKYGDLNVIALEENLAEDFRKYVLLEETPVLGKAIKLLRTVKHIVKNLFGKENYIDNLFYKILRGKMAVRQQMDASEERLSDEMKEIKKTAIESGTFMKAPNGHQSNLSQRQWLQVRTKAFKDWFGDWENNPAEASKVLDKNGEPLIVYHNTNKEFTSFSKMRALFSSLTGGNIFGTGFYFSNYRGDSLGEIDMPVFLNVRTPSTSNMSSSNDGMIHDFKNGQIWYAAKNANLIKSTIDNVGTFEKSKDNIYYRVASIEELLLVSLTPKDVKEAIDSYQQQYYIATRYRKLIESQSFIFKLDAIDRITDSNVPDVLYPHEKYGRWRLGIKRVEKYNKELNELYSLFDKSVKGERTSDAKISLFALDLEDDWENRLQEHRREKYMRSNLTQEQLDYIKERGISEEEYDLMSTDEKETLMFCML